MLFEEIKSKYASTHVKGHSNGDPFSGTMYLKGFESQLTLFSDAPVEFVRVGDSNVLRMHSDDGKAIIAYHCVHLSILRDPRTKAVKTDIFANIVILEADDISDKCEVRGLYFRFDGIDQFFNYDYIEWISTNSFEKRARQHTLNLRRDAQRRLRAKDLHRTYDFSSPTDVVVVHKPGRIVRFRVGEAKYEIGLAMSTGVGLRRANVDISHVARINFDKAVSIELALNRLLEWQRIFAQLSFQPVTTTEISLKEKTTSNVPWAHLYLPNSTSPNDSTFRRKTSFVKFPYFEWKERGKFSGLMEAWVDSEELRRRFRAEVDSVIRTIHERYSLNDIVTLCTAIESLPFSQSQPEYTDDQLSTIADAVEKSATEYHIKIDSERVAGVLKLLNFKSLQWRIKEVISKSNVNLTGKEKKSLLNAVARLRRAAAHGSEPTEYDMLRIGPTTVALAAVCVIYDLVTCDPNLKPADLSSYFHLKEGLSEIVRLASLEKRDEG